LWCFAGFAGDVVSHRWQGREGGEKKIENKDKKKGERRRQNKEKEMGLFFDTERRKKPLLKHERKRGKRKTE
jgi:hypothetical protein